MTRDPDGLVRFRVELDDGRGVVDLDNRSIDKLWEIEPKALDAFRASTEPPSLASGGGQGGEGGEQGAGAAELAVDATTDDARMERLYGRLDGRLDDLSARVDEIGTAVKLCVAKMEEQHRNVRAAFKGITEHDLDDREQFVQGLHRGLLDDADDGALSAPAALTLPSETGHQEDRDGHSRGTDHVDATSPVHESMTDAERDKYDFRGGGVTSLAYNTVASADVSVSDV